jgi:hypothetical protein
MKFIENILKLFIKDEKILNSLNIKYCYKKKFNIINLSNQHHYKGYCQYILNKIPKSE